MAALIALTALAIYPDKHFTTDGGPVTKCTAETMPKLITESLAADKTLFVRFIASEG
jgi:hypothetical protein